MLIKTNCTQCGKEICRIPYRIKTFKNQFCNRKCKGEWSRGKPLSSRNRIKTNCSWCNKILYRVPSRIKKYKHQFCNLKCTGKWSRGKSLPTKKRIEVNCDFCNKTIYRIPYRINTFKNQFCNKKCKGKWMREHPTEYTFKKGMIPKKPFLKGNTLCKGRPNPTFRKLNKNPEFIKKRLKACIKKPNKPEKQLIKILQQNFPKEFKYVGDGSFLIGYKNPDFINCNGQKICIEVFGDYWHKEDRKGILWHQTEKGCKKYYTKYGFKTLIIWENELKNEQKVIEKINNFVGAKN